MQRQSMEWHIGGMRMMQYQVSTQVGDRIVRVSSMKDKKEWLIPKRKVEMSPRSFV